MSGADETRHQERVVLGMTAALGAFFMFTVMNVFAKLLSERHSVIEIAFYRNAIAIIPFLIMIFVFGRREIAALNSKPLLVGLRGLLGTVSLTATFFAYSMLPMAETTALLFTASLYIPVLGVIFLREAVGPYRWTAVGVGFAGVLIMLRPGADVAALGVAVALGAAMLQAIMQVILRHLGRHERPETITFYFFLVGTLVTALALPFVAVTPTAEEIPLLFGTGISGVIAQLLLTIAFRNASAAIVTVFNYSGIVWAMLLGWLIFNDWPLPTVLLGAAIVIGSNVLIIWRESRVRKITGDRVRARL